MNKQKQLQIITNLRAENYPYSAIAKQIGSTTDTVKSICRRKNINPNPGIAPKTKKEIENLMICKYCSKPFTNPWNRKGKTFCSDECRTNYWNEKKSEERKAARQEDQNTQAPKSKKAGLNWLEELCYDGKEAVPW